MRRDPRRLTEADIWAAVDAVRFRAHRTDRRLQVLDGAGPADVALALALLGRTVTAAADRGWSRTDLDHVVGRRTSAAHARLLSPDAGGGDLRMIAECLAVVVTLPELPDDQTPDGGLSGLDPKVLARVRALLSKAESTQFEAEAEALTGKAQELIARHAIDALSLSAGVDRPVSRRIHLDDPYLDTKAALLDGVAKANRCSAVFTPAFGWCTVFGFPSDIDAVELLTRSLLAQAAHAVSREGTRVDAAGRSRTKSFRRSFLAGFAHRVGQRLAEATAGQVAATPDAGALLPVLASRDERVAALQAETYPRLTSKATRVSNAGGWVAGQVAGDGADLSVGAGAVRARSRGEG